MSHQEQDHLLYTIKEGIDYHTAFRYAIENMLISYIWDTVYLFSFLLLGRFLFRKQLSKRHQKIHNQLLKFIIVFIFTIGGFYFSILSAFNDLNYRVTLIMSIVLASQPYIYYLFGPENRTKIKVYAWWIFIIFIQVFVNWAMRDICICVYNEENGFQFMEQEYQISTNFLRYFFMPHGKVCKDGEIYHTYFTLGEDSATQTYIGIHSGSDIEYLDLQYCKLNEIYECVEDLGNINYQIKIKGVKLRQVEHRAERNIFKQKIENLTPNTLYSFKLINPTNNQTLYQTNYQTLSENDSIKLIEGGDSGVTQRARNLIKQIKNIDPHALIIGGDIAYDDGIRGCYYSWDTFLKMWEQELFQPLNKTIPFIFTLGNHDVGYNAVENVVVKEKPLYFDFFTFSDDNQNYHAHKLGNILLLCLDSGYMAHPSQQKDFIDFYSNKYKNLQKFAVYHVPIYPVCLETDTIWHVDLHSMEAMEENWVKLFEKNKFIGAFENHYHLFKRTYPIKQRQIDHENGVIYFGDGSFGLNPPYSCIEENKRDKTFPIFEKFQYQESDHIWVLESQSDHLKIDSINGYGQYFEQNYTIKIKQ